MGSKVHAGLGSMYAFRMERAPAATGTDVVTDTMTGSSFLHQIPFKASLCALYILQLVLCVLVVGLLASSNYSGWFKGSHNMRYTMYSRSEGNFAVFAALAYSVVVAVLALSLSLFGLTWTAIEVAFPRDGSLRMASGPLCGL